MNKREMAIQSTGPVCSSGSTPVAVHFPAGEAEGREPGSRFSGALTALKAMTPGTLLPVAIGILAAGVVLLARPLLPDQGVRLLAALIGTSGWLYIFLAFDNPGPIRSVLTLAAAVAVFGMSLAGVEGSAAWLTAGFATHALWGALHVKSSSGWSRGAAYAKGWTAFNSVLALAVIFVIL